MLFNSLEFILFFLPFALISFFTISKFHKPFALVFITTLSALFVAWKNPAFLYLIFCSIVINYLIFCCQQKLKTKRTKRVLFSLGMLFNVFYLFYFKYFNFTIHTCDFLFGWQLETKEILLPLAISFYTFQQISFLHDALSQKIEDVSLLKYSCFILFFPQLIAGPIIRHQELIPNFSKKSFYKLDTTNLAVGISLFTFGLFKKVIFADTAASLVNPLYTHVSLGGHLNLLESWVAIFAFSFQIYFDFSGYSDMAVGLGRMFNVKFPQNFNSPYQSVSIIDFWRRWHISLSTFLKENLYIPLGGGHNGPFRKVCNLMMTMLLGGLWHGASWTFVIWGGIHGCALSINHLLKKRIPAKEDFFLVHLMKQVAIFFFISFAWIFFRAENTNSAMRMLKSALGFHGSGFNQISVLLPHMPLHFLFLACLYGLVLLFPNTFDWHRKFQPSLDYNSQKTPFPSIFWRPNTAWAILILIGLFYSFGYINHEQEFIYFQF